LSSLFDLSKEFSGILQTEMIGKLLVYSLIGQMLVSKYSIITCAGDEIIFLENRFDEKRLREALKDCTAEGFVRPLLHDEIKEKFHSFTILV